MVKKDDSAGSLPRTTYQWCLYAVACPFLALVFGPVKPGAVLLGWFCWMGAMTMVPKNVALLGIVLPLASFLLSMTAAVLLLCDMEIRRYEARGRDQDRS